jgi:hypothetical protein
MRWHYTVGECLFGMLTDGFIKQATAFVEPPEKPVVWFTSSHNWEEMANKGWEGRDGIIYSLNRDQTEKLCGGLFRIGVTDDYPLRRFIDITRDCNQDPKLTRALVKIAREGGSYPHSDWWGTLEQVPLADWAVIEHFTPDGWRPLILEDMVELDRFMEQRLRRSGEEVQDRLIGTEVNVASAEGDRGNEEARTDDKYSDKSDLD